MKTASASFDWLSDLGPLHAACDTWHDGSYNQPASCQLVFRAAAPFAIACGAALLAEHIRRFRFSPEVIQRLGQATDTRGRSVFDESFLNHLQRLRLRIHVAAPPEGTLLLPGEPLLIARGPLEQLELLRSAFRLLFWESTYWTTRAALRRWENEDWVEEDTPPAPPVPFNPAGWKIRAAYVGGAGAGEILDNAEHHAPEPTTENCVIETSSLVQIRRLFKSNHPLGDVWLSREQEEAASVSKTTAAFRDEHTHRVRHTHFSRFQNLYQPVLAKGQPVLAAPRLGYFRQRTLKQMEAFGKGHLEHYGVGWWEA